METSGIASLADYGVLGIVVLACFAVIVWLAKQQKASIKTIVEDKDSQIKDWKHSAEKRDVQLDGVLAQLTNNSTQLIGLYERLQSSIDEVPQRTAEKIKLTNK